MESKIGTHTWNLSHIYNHKKINISNEKLIGKVTLGTIIKRIFTSTGDPCNSTWPFREQSYSLETMNTKQLPFIFIPAIELGSQEYMLMFGAQNGVLTILKATKVNIFDY